MRSKLFWLHTLKIVGLGVVIFFTPKNYAEDKVAQETVRVRADVWCPYTCDPASEKHEGLLIDMLRKAFENSPYTIDYQIMNWNRAKEEAAKGNIDAIAGAGNSDAPGFVFPSSEQYYSQDCFFSAPDSKWNYTNPESLKSKKIGTILAYSYTEELDAYMKKSPANFEAISGDDPGKANYLKLQAHRIEAFIDSKNVIIYLMDQMKTPVPRIAGCMPKEKIFIAFAPKGKNSKVWADILSKGMTKLKKSGDYQKILSSYGLSTK